MGSTNAGQKLLGLSGLYLDSVQAADKPGIQAARDGHVRCPLHQRAAVREQREDVISALKTQQKPVEIYFSVGFQAALHLGKIDRPMVFMDLHRVAAAQRDLRTIFPAEIGKIPLLANGAPRPGAAARISA